MRLFSILLIGSLTACTTLDRSVRSGYAAAPTRAAEDADESRGADGRLAREAREELGLGDGPLTSPERDALSARVRLKRAEARLPNRRERRAWYALRGNLTDDDERLRVISLPTTAARARYAIDRKVGSPDQNRSDELAAVIENKDIALGMTQKAVAESWGDPDQVEVSGDTIYGVERWRYNRYVSGGEGYRKETRVVYFDGGRVAGWERK